MCPPPICNMPGPGTRHKCSGCPPVLLGCRSGNFLYLTSLTKNPAARRNLRLFIQPFVKAFPGDPVPASAKLEVSKFISLQKVIHCRPSAHQNVLQILYRIAALLRHFRHHAVRKIIFHNCFHHHNVLQLMVCLMSSEFKDEFICWIYRCFFAII